MPATPPPYPASRRESSPTTSGIRVIAVDDHPAIREAIADTIRAEQGMELCGLAGSAADAFDLVRETDPDVAVIDISLGDAHGLDLVQNLRAQHPKLEVVVFSMYDEEVYAERAIRAGARGYVMKSEPTQSVAEAIRAAAQGEIYLNRKAASRILSKVAGGNRDSSEPGLEDLTDREMAVFQMLGQGKPTEEIAERLNLSRKTVETYRRRAKEKLGFDTVTELLQFAIRWTYAQGNAPQ
jgi:DNA-binding NarL/FixJ family response regulator